MGTSPLGEDSYETRNSAYFGWPSSLTISPRLSQTEFFSRPVTTPWVPVLRRRHLYWIESALLLGSQLGCMHSPANT